MTQTRSGAGVFSGMKDWMKRTSVAARSQLSEDSTFETELRLYHEMDKIVWQQRVVTGCWIHFEIGQR
jgi:hypothetical protein